MAELALFFAVSAIAALLFNPVTNFLNKGAGQVSNTQVQQLLNSFFGRTAITTTAFFIVLIASASLMSLVAGKKAADVPTLT